MSNKNDSECSPCDCICHDVPGTMHFRPCCNYTGQSRKEFKEKINQEDNAEIKVDDVLDIMITGIVGPYKAKVVEIDSQGKPRLKVINDESWSKFILKPGDYIIMGKAAD